MNHPIRSLAALAMAGVLLAPAVAQADPCITASVGGIAFTGSDGELGQWVNIAGADCVDPATSLPGYMGEFISTDGDPLTNPNFQWGERLTEGTGSFATDVEIPLENGSGIFYGRWYCSSGPVTSIDAAEMLWVSPVMWMDIHSAPTADTLRSTATATVKAHGWMPVAPTRRGAVETSVLGRPTSPTSNRRTATSGQPPVAPNGMTVSVGMDPDSLPAIDRINIPGPQAAALKAKVDANAKGLAKLAELIRRAITHKPASATAPAPTNQQYVDAAFLTLTNKVPTARVTKPYVDRLDAGAVKVAIDEDIALTAHAASWWIRKA